VWPANPESYFALGAKVQASRFPETHFVRQRANLLGPLFDPDTSFSEVAQILVAVCLNEGMAEVTGLAVDRRW
jgi:hypothetical protein